MIHEHQFGELALLTTSRSEARTKVVVILTAVTMVVEVIAGLIAYSTVVRR